MKKSLFLMIMLLFVFVSCSNVSSDDEDLDTSGNSEQPGIDTTKEKVGITLQVDLKSDTVIFFVFRKGPNDTDYIDYGEVSLNDYDYELQTYKPFPNNTKIEFNDPFVEKGKEYSYRIQYCNFRFDNFRYNDSEFLESVVATSGKGEINLLNNPKFTLSGKPDKILITEAPVFNITPTDLGIKMSFGNSFYSKFAPYNTSEIDMSDEYFPVHISDYDTFHFTPLYTMEANQFETEQIYIKTNWIKFDF